MPCLAWHFPETFHVYCCHQHYYKSSYSRLQSFLLWHLTLHQKLVFPTAPVENMVLSPKTTKKSKRKFLQAVFPGSRQTLQLGTILRYRFWYHISRIYLLRFLDYPHKIDFAAIFFQQTLCILIQVLTQLSDAYRCKIPQDPITEHPTRLPE